MTTSPPSPIATATTPVVVEGHELRSAKYIANGSTTSRAEALDVTWGRLQPLLHDAGITRVANVTGLDIVGIPVFAAIKPLGRTLASGSGKGVTPDAARVGAAMEAWEQTVWEAQTLGPVLASEHELAADDQAFVPSATLPRQRNHLLTPRRRVHWTRGWDIVNQQSVLVPSVGVCIPQSSRGVWGGTLVSSNGLASGNSVLEAVCSGLLEVIERDTSATRHATPRSLNLNTLTDEVAVDLIARIRRAGLTVEVEEITNDTDVPVFAALIHERDNSSAGSFHGHGASLNSDLAVIRAITEAAQSRALVIAGSRDDIFDMERRAAVRIGARQRTPARTDASHHTDYFSRDESTQSFEGDVHVLLARIQRLGFDRVIVVRHTTDSDPLHVVRVIVPGMRMNLQRSSEGYPEGPSVRDSQSGVRTESRVES